MGSWVDSRIRSWVDGFMVSMAVTELAKKEMKCGLPRNPLAIRPETLFLGHFGTFWDINRRSRHLGAIQTNEGYDPVSQGQAAQMKSKCLFLASVEP